MPLVGSAGAGSPTAPGGVPADAGAPAVTAGAATDRTGAGLGD